MRENSVPAWGALLCALTANFFKNWDAILLQTPSIVDWDRTDWYRTD
jgi:hypothetical protein